MFASARRAGSGAPAVAAWGEWQASVDFDGYLDPESFALLPLLYTNLRRNAVVHPFMHKLKGIYRRRWCENQVQFQGIEEVVGRFHLSRIPTMLVNGAALSLVYYADSALEQPAILKCLFRYEERSRLSHCS